MFNPKYRILIMSDCFPQDTVICLGTQLISIVNSIKGLLPEHIWYGADVDAFGKGVRNYNLESFQLTMIGTDRQFIEYCSGVEQFIWGVFLGIRCVVDPQTIQGIELGTEDEPFRPIDCDGILLEIRTFDTTYFEISSEDLDLIKKISELYDVEIEEIKSS